MRPDKPLSDADIEAIERATVAALAPRVVREDDAWLLAADDGRINRANSVTLVGLGGDRLADKVARVEAFYADEGLPSAFRIPDRLVFGDLRTTLAAAGYTPRLPTLVQVGEVQTLLERLTDPPGEVSEAIDANWIAAFGGEGFDPDDAASRARALGRSPGAVYGAVREDGAVHAVGAMSFGLGWAGVHGMRTIMPSRGRGLARRVLVALALAARDRRTERLYLQVERENAPAIALYRRAGFRPAWSYAYWRRVR